MFILFIVFASVTFLVIIFFIVFPFIKKKKYIASPKKAYWKGIYRLAMDNDYYLINNLTLENVDGKKLIIDHLLFGDKYLYAIYDVYYDGAIKYKIEDNSWIYYTGRKNKPQQKYVNNPLLINKKRIHKLAVQTCLDEQYFISIVLVNDDALIEEINNPSGTEFLIRKKHFKKLIKGIESRDVPLLKKNELAYVVRDIAKMNIRP